MAQYEKLFQAVKIGNLSLKNRIVMAAITTNYATADGKVTPQLIDYYVARARGGCGLIIVEAAFPRPGGYPQRLYLGDNAVIPGLKQLVAAIHAAGGRVGLQILDHRGRGDRVDPAGPSAATDPLTGASVRAMAIEDLIELQRVCAQGAIRAREAGFDCIQIHGAYGHLIPSFLSPLTNKRTDKYGGDIHNRARYALELLAAVKQAVGIDYPVLFKLTGDERVHGGFGLEDAAVLAELLEEAGAAALSIGGAGDRVAPYMYQPTGCNAHLAAAVRWRVEIPVAACGKISSPQVAETILMSGQADLVEIGRALVADPDFPGKAAGGREADIRSCIACNRCIESVLRPPAGTMICSVNPAVGREAEFAAGLRPAVASKRVLVIGGGPAGMEAAAVAAQRGYRVTLWEHTDRLGGQLNLAVVPPGKQDLANYLEYQQHRMSNLGVEVELREAATADTVAALSADVVIVAVGARPLVPDIKGRDRRPTVTFDDCLSGKVALGPRVIVVGGGFVGCETADFLAEQGKQVTIAEILPQLASELFSTVAGIIVQRLEQVGVTAYTGVKAEEITPQGMEIIDREGKRRVLEADDIVIAAGSVANQGVFQSLEGKVPVMYQVGDCVRARRIHEAVSEAATAALQI